MMLMVIMISLIPIYMEYHNHVHTKVVPTKCNDVLPCPVSIVVVAVVCRDALTARICRERRDFPGKRSLVKPLELWNKERR